MIKKLFKARKNRLIALAILIIFMGGVVFSTLVLRKEAKADWWDDGWIYRKRVAVDNTTGSNQTDLQIAFTIDAASLITAGKMQSDCDDLRVTDKDGNLLPYWIEVDSSNCNTASTKVWTKLASIPSSDTYIYIYYGNPSVANAKDPDKVFDFFDDFEQNNLDRWTGSLRGASGTVQRTTSIQAYDGIYAAESYQTTDGGDTVAIKSLTSTSRITEYQFYDTSTITSGGTWIAGSTIGSLMFGVDNNVSTINYSYRCAAGFVTTSVARSTGWHKVKIVYTGSTSTIYIDGASAASGISCNINNVAFGSYWTFQSGMYADQFFTRKYVSADPTLTLGSEEKGPAPLVYYSFDQGNDNTCTGGINDVCNQGSGGSLDAAQSNMTSPSATSGWQTEDQCVSGKCLRFDASDDVVAASSTETATDDLGAMTISAWIKPDGYGESNLGRIFDKSTANGPINGWVLHMDSNYSIDFAVGYDGASDLILAAASGSVAINRWNHIVVTWDGTATATNAHIFINGKEVSYGLNVNGQGNRDSDSGSSFRVGNSPTGEHTFDGTIDEVKVYNFVKTADQIKAEFNARGAVKGISVRFGDDKKFLSDGLVGYWKMEETATPSLDSSGNGHSGTWGGNTASTTGKYGNSVTNDGTQDYISVTQTPALNFGNDFTVSVWLKTTTSLNDIVGATFISKDLGGCGSPQDWFANVRSGTVRFWTSDTIDCTQVVGTKTVNNGQWHNVILTRIRASGEHRIYIDGVLDISQIGSKLSVSNTTNLLIGDISTSQNLSFPGDIDEVRIYDRAFSASEVADLYNWAPGPVGYWKFDEGSGSTAYDLSGNNYVSTLINSPTWSTGKFGSGLNFDGSSNYVQLDSSFTALDGKGAMTTSAWIKPSFASNAGSRPSRTLINRGSWTSPMIRFADDGSQYFIECDLYNSSSGNFNANTAFAGNPTWSANTWHFISCRYTGSELELYWDNQLIASDITATGNIHDTSGNMAIGANGAAQYFSGIIDDVKFYDYARTPSQIIEDMNAGHPAPGSPVGSATLWWKFDEGYGTTANDAGSSGSYDATIGSTYWLNAGKFGKAANISGIAQKINAGDVGFTDSLTQMTISMWVNPQTLTTARCMISKADFGTDSVFTFRTDTTNSDEVRMYVASSATDISNYYLTNNLDLTTSLWTHLTLVYDGTGAASDRVKIYKNGVLKTGSVTGTIPTSLLTNTINMIIGEASSASCSGLLSYYDEVKIYTSALTADQVKVEFNQGKAQVFGATSTDASNNPSWSATNEYCPPGQGSTCTPPVVEWKFDESSGTDANDTSGNNATGTLTSGPIWVPNIRDSSWALSFDGSNDSVERVFQPVSAFPFTLQAWVKTSTIDTNDRIIWIGDKDVSGAGEVQYAIGMDGSGVIRHFAYDGTNTDASVGTTVLTNGEWHMVTVVFESATSRKIYTDAELEATATTSITYNTAVDKMCIAKACDATPGSNINGEIDDARIYNYARTQAQIAWDYNHGGPVAWWKFDECSGTTANDSSGNGNNGTITPGSSGNTAAGTCNSGTTTEMWNDGTTGKRNASLGFDETDDYVTVSAGSATALDIDSNPVSISAWVKTADLTGHKAIVGRGLADDPCNGTEGYGLFIEDGGEVSVGGFGGSCLSTTQTISNDTWTHVVGITNDTSTYIYVNGVLFATGNVDVVASNQNLIIGATRNIPNSGYRNFFNGQIDDVRIYNYALTTQQVRDVMNEGAVRFGN